MSYTPTNWLDDSAPPINAANLNHIETGIVDLATNGKLPATVYFGSALDTNLYRAVANVLRTDGEVQVTQNLRVIGNGYAITNRNLDTGSRIGFQIAINNSANDRLNIAADGTIQWGDGTAAVDTKLYRSAAGTLKTDGQFYAASTLQTDVDMYARVGTTRVQIGAAGPGAVAGIAFGTAGATDTNLYRASAGQLKTDTGLSVTGTLNSGWSGSLWNLAVNSTNVAFFGSAGATKAAHPTVLADVITILTNLGLCA